MNAKHAIITTMLVLFPCVAMAKNAPITDIQAVRAILGEGEGESIIGMTALGEVIRKRGSMKGIYGYNAVQYVNGRYMRGKRTISPMLALQALKAWKASASTNYSRNAQGWGNAGDLVAFRKQAWFKKCYITVKLGNHYFWGV